MSPAFVLAAALAVQPAPAVPHSLTFSASRSLPPTSTEVRVGSLPGLRGRAARHYWFQAVRLDIRGPERRLSTDTDACPGARAVLESLGEMEMPALVRRPDDPIVIAGDATAYRLTAPAYWASGTEGTVTLDAISGTGLADWIDAMLGALRPCWADEAAPAPG
jgi:hypothetical protein